MKFLVFSCVVIGVLAEPPRFRQARFRFQRQELAPPTTDASAESTTEAAGPYPPSGWKPAGQPFSLPTETGSAPDNAYGPPDPALVLPQQQLPPATSYGVPDNTYGPPANVYGAPANAYGAPSTDDAETANDNPAAENVDVAADLPDNSNTYYVLLPNGMLQKVIVAAKNDVESMKPARLQLRRRPASAFRIRP